MMKGDGPAKKKKDCHTEAERLFRVGTRAFKRAWDNAITETDNTKWNKPGPKT